MAYQMAPTTVILSDLEPWMTLKVIHRLQGFWNAIHRPYVQHWERASTQDPSALADLFDLYLQYAGYMVTKQQKRRIISQICMSALARSVDRRRPWPCLLYTSDAADE